MTQTDVDTLRTAFWLPKIGTVWEGEREREVGGGAGEIRVIDRSLTLSFSSLMTDYSSRISEEEDSLACLVIRSIEIEINR